MKQVLIEINQDSIRELKNQGKFEEAKALLQAYYKDIKQAGKNVRSDMLKHDRMIKKIKNICCVVSCFKERFRSGLCEKCYNLKMKSEKNRCKCGKTKMKSSINCIMCKIYKNRKGITYNTINSFYNRLKKLKVELGKTYTTKELTFMIGYKISSQHCIYIFIKKCINY